MGRDRFVFHVPLAMRGRSVAYRFSCSAVASTRIGYRMAGYGHRRYADRQPRDGGEGAAGAGELSGRLGKAVLRGAHTSFGQKHSGRENARPENRCLMLSQR